MTDRLGLEMRFYRNSGTEGTPIWNEIDVVDLRRNLSKGVADLSKRGQGGWKQERATLKTGRISFGMIYDGADTEYTNLETHFLAESPSPFQVAIADGDITVTGTRYLLAFVDIFDFPTEEPLENGVTSEIEMGIAPGTAPSLETVA